MYDRIRFSDDLINIIKKLQIYIFKSPSIALCNTRTVDKSIHDMYIFDDNLGGA